MWAWLKKNWKWFIAPLWITSMVLVWLFKGGRDVVVPDSGTSDEAADTLAEEKDKALQEFRQRLDELYAKARQRLEQAGEEQLGDFNNIKDEPIEKVSAWIDDIE